MITVRMLGGARRSFPTDVTLDCGDVTVSVLLDMLIKSKPSGTPDLDIRNILVAINGADSSVQGGLAARVQDGDRVDIIPIIHGGAEIHRMDVGGVYVAALRLPCADLDELRRRFAGIKIQSINTEYILGYSHLRRILEISVEAERLGTMLTTHIETDLMLRLVGTTQISDAIRLAGAHAGTDVVVVAMGDSSSLDVMCNELSDMSLPFPEPASGAPECYGVVQVPPGRNLEEMLAERAAVL